MDKKMLVVIAIITSLIISSVVFLLSQKSIDQPSTPPAAQGTETEPSSLPPTDPPASGKYTAYSSEAVTATHGTKILFFHAPWCPQCRALETSIETGSIPEGVTIFKVDYDSNQELRQRYGVTIQTTLVRIDDDGNLVKKYVAYDEPSLASVTENLLR